MKTIASIILIIATVTIAEAQYSSVYTSLSTKACKELRSDPDEGGIYEGECPGAAGFRLRLIEGDLRQSIDVITPDKKKFQLGFWNVTGAFNYVGEKAEWRLKGKKPVALIVRLTANKDPIDTKKTTSMLVVSKVSRSAACITDVVEPSRKQNEIARKLADESSKKPCKYKAAD